MVPQTPDVLDGVKILTKLLFTIVVLKIFSTVHSVSTECGGKKAIYDKAKYLLV